MQRSPALRGAKGLRDAWRRLVRRRLLRTQVRRNPLKIVLGSSRVHVRDWLLTDMDQLDITVEADWQRYFTPGSVDAILAEHVWEHLTPDQAVAAARNCFAYLRPGGRLRIAVPDGLHPDPEYIEAVRPMGSAKGSDDHKVLYTCDTLKHLMENAGFGIRVLECFDANGRFFSSDWDPEDGMIRRSARFDSRNSDGVLRYTSIIMDVFKPQT